MTAFGSATSESSLREWEAFGSATSESLCENSESATKRTGDIKNGRYMEGVDRIIEICIMWDCR